MDIDKLTTQMTSLIKSGKSVFHDTERLKLDGSFLVALSGGADSVALLRALLALGYGVEAAHCNFHLRGEESDRDERFCENLCREMGVELHLAHFDTREYAELHGVSIEMAARTLRYDYFSKLVDDLHLDGVCVAHHRDDSVETVLLNMTRGTGLDGLKGITRRNGKVIRPLLGVSRRDLELYLESLNQDYITDSTNLVDDVQRNKIRLNVIPELLAVNPSAVGNIQKMTAHVTDALEIVEAFIDGAQRRITVMHGDDMTLSISRLLAEPGSETLLWYLLKDKDFSSSQVEEIYSRIGLGEAKSGRILESSTHSLLIDRNEIVVQLKKDDTSCLVKIPETGMYIIDSERKIAFRSTMRTPDFAIPKEARFACLDADKVAFPLTVRTLQNGDWFIPFGMTGRKLVSDFLTDRKLSLFAKRRQLAVADATGNIVWLVGQRPDNRFCIAESTTKILVAELKQS